MSAVIARRRIVYKRPDGESVKLTMHFGDRTVESELVVSFRVVPGSPGTREMPAELPFCEIDGIWLKATFFTGSGCIVRAQQHKRWRWLGSQLDNDHDQERLQQLLDGRFA